MKNEFYCGGFKTYPEDCEKQCWMCEQSSEEENLDLLRMLVKGPDEEYIRKWVQGDVINNTKPMKQITVEVPKGGKVWQSVKIDEEEFKFIMDSYHKSGKLHLPILNGQVSFGSQLLEEAVVSIMDV